MFSDLNSLSSVSCHPWIIVGPVAIGMNLIFIITGIICRWYCVFLTMLNLINKTLCSLKGIVLFSKLFFLND